MALCLYALVSLLHAWVALSEVSVEKQCDSLKVSGDKYISINGKYLPDHSLQTMYKYDKFVNFTVFKHTHKNSIVYFIGKPFYWVVGRVEHVYTGQFYYTNRQPTIKGPWYTALDGSDDNIWKKIVRNNLSIVCNQPGPANNSHSKVMFLVVIIKIVIVGRLLRFFA